MTETYHFDWEKAKNNFNEARYVAKMAAIEKCLNKLEAESKTMSTMNVTLHEELKEFINTTNRLIKEDFEDIIRRLQIHGFKLYWYKIEDRYQCLNVQNDWSK